jgi:hypothetical protein
MIPLARWRWLAVIGALIQATWIVSGCGSTSPVAPSPPTATTAQLSVEYPSLAGYWGGSAGLTVQFLDTLSLYRFFCDAETTVSQIGGSFSGVIGLRGASMSGDKECPSGFSYAAQMAPDGTITSASVHGNPASLGSHECVSVADLTFHDGMATSTGFKIQVTDHARCYSPPLLDTRLPMADTERTFTVSIDHLRIAAISNTPPVSMP